VRIRFLIVAVAELGILNLLISRMTEQAPFSTVSTYISLFRSDRFNYAHYFLLLDLIKFFIIITNVFWLSNCSESICFFKLTDVNELLAKVFAWRWRKSCS